MAIKEITEPLFKDLLDELMCYFLPDCKAKGHSCKCKCGKEASQCCPDCQSTGCGCTGPMCKCGKDFGPLM